MTGIYPDTILDILLSSIKPRLEAAGIPNPKVETTSPHPGNNRVIVKYYYWDPARISDLENGTWDSPYCFIRRKIGYAIDTSKIVPEHILKYHIEHQVQRIIDDWNLNRAPFHRRVDDMVEPTLKYSTRYT